MKKSGNRTARNAILNILVMPGLGSLLSGRWVAGTGQIIIVTVGAVMLFIWLYKVLAQYYGLMFGDVQSQTVGWIGEIGGVLFAVSWLWSAVTSLSLFREAAAQEGQPSGNDNIPPQLKSVPQIIGVPAELPQWKREGEIISRTFAFPDFSAAMVFVNAVAELAEQAQHHPDIDVRWNKVTLALTTHDAGGLTEKDFALARQCDALAKQTA
jgi:4a-hydroxytetrahydrobiopterin dehydratase